MSHILLATVLLDREITFSFESLVSSSIVDTISKAAGGYEILCYRVCFFCTRQFYM